MEIEKFPFLIGKLQTIASLFRLSSDVTVSIPHR